jgi:hypothetical protein
MRPDTPSPLTVCESLLRVSVAMQASVTIVPKRRQELLQVVAPDPRVASALHWARQRLDSALADAPGMWTAFALLALGDFAAVRSMIAFLGTKQDPRGQVVYEGTTSDSPDNSTPLYLLLVARYHAASGHLAFVRAEWTQVRAALDYCRSSDADGDGWRDTFNTAGIWAAAVRELALTAEAIGERAECDRLRADAESLDELFGDSSMHTGWMGWAEYTAGHTAAGFRRWWQHVLLCLEHDHVTTDEGRYGPAKRTAGGCLEQERAAAMAVATFAYGVLGFEPDAAKHRARLRPAIPPEWDALDVHNLRVGDITLSLCYTRTDTIHSFRLSPTSGPVPLRLVFEPAVSARGINSISIDGVAAALDVRAWGDRLLCPLQIVLDHDRELVVRTGPA